MKKEIGILLFSCVCFCQTYAEKRLALIVGNSEYGKNNFLENPVHDAEDISSKLATLDFEIIKLTDASLREMHETISDFSIKAKDYDVILFYYSGHGLQTKGENYLMPIDAELKSEADVKYACLPLNLLLDKLDESGCPMIIIVLDACRNNPFVKRWYRGDMSQGLASVSPPKGTFITFSTAAGSVALDGIGRNSPYTTAFLETLEEPNLSLFDFFNEVGQKVLKKTNDSQDPWTNHNTMRGKFLFNISQKDKDIAIVDQLSILPPWISNKSDNEWIGISVPLPNKEEAKRMAVLSALLKYISSVGGIRINLFGEVQMMNYQTKVVNDLILSNTKNSIDIVCELGKFSIEIKNEYFNNNNEFFVLCSIKENENDNYSNSIKVTRKIQSDIYRKATNAAISVEALIDNEVVNLEYDFNSSVFVVGRHHLSFNGKEIAMTINNYPDYSSCSSTKENAFPLINISECGCLGIAELALMAQFPVLPEQIVVRNMSNLEMDGEASAFKSTSLFQCKTTTQPVYVKLVQIKNQHLCISLQDPYEALGESIHSIPPSIETTEDGFPIDLVGIIKANNGSIYWNWNYSSFEGGPIMLGKTLGMYHTLSILSEDKSTTTVSSEMSFVEGKTTETTASNNSFTFSRYYPFFLLDGLHSELEQSPLVVNRVVVLTKEDH